MDMIWKVALVLLVSQAFFFGGKDQEGSNGLQSFSTLVEAAFVPVPNSNNDAHHNAWTSSSRYNTITATTSISAAPKRLSDNVDGVVYVNDKCINCAACANFAPSVFNRNEQDTYHRVYNQPSSEQEIYDARAALAACPVAAIRVETLAQRRHRGTSSDEKKEIENSWSNEDEILVQKMAINPKHNGIELPFPKSILQQSQNDNSNNVYYLGHHNERSFGAVPYIFKSKSGKWIMIDTPKYSKSSINAVETLTGESGPDYLLLTHVDDTADHNKWKEHYPNKLKRIFHSNDLGEHNWLRDSALEEVEILLQDSRNYGDDDFLQAYTLDGKPITLDESFWNTKSYHPTGNEKNENNSEITDDDDVIIFHTPGHSPGSISLWKRPRTDGSPGILFTGDTYAYTTRFGGLMSGFPRYGHDLRMQSETIKKLLKLDWDVVLPGHGHPRDYTNISNKEIVKEKEMNEALEGLSSFRF